MVLFPLNINVLFSSCCRFVINLFIHKQQNHFQSRYFVLCQAIISPSLNSAPYQFLSQSNIYYVKQSYANTNKRYEGVLFHQVVAVQNKPKHDKQQIKREDLMLNAAHCDSSKHKRHIIQICFVFHLNINRNKSSSSLDMHILINISLKRMTLTDGIKFTVY